MVDLDIIEPVQKPTDWVNGLVVVKNQTENTEYVPTQELWTKPLNVNNSISPLPLSGASYFWKLDASSGYWQIKVDEQSSNLLKFFRRKLLQLFRTYQAVRIPKTTVVWGKPLQEHHERLRKVFLKIKESGLKLNRTKCEIRKQSIVFLGHIISSEGNKIDASKPEAITKMPLLKSGNELQRFLGIANYLRKITRVYHSTT